MENVTDYDKGEAMGKKSEAIFKTYPKEIRFMNYASFRALGLGTFVISLGITLLAFVLPQIYDSRWIYLIWVIVSGGCVATIIFSRKIARRYALELLYILSALVLVTAIISGTVLFRDGSSGVVVGFLVIFPFVLLDRFWRMYLFEFIMAVLFCVLSLAYKDISIATVDCANGIGFAFLACILGTNSIKTKLANIEAQAIIREQRDTDKLTGLKNRAAAEREVKEWLNKGTGLAAFCLLDVDKFKNVNDTFGHLEGDRILIHAGDVIRKQFREEDCLARFGGDEFLLFLKDVPDSQWLEERAESLNNTFRYEVKRNGASLDLSVSIGITMCCRGQTFEQIYRLADKALYHVKKNGRNGYWIERKIKSANDAERRVMYAGESGLDKEIK